MAKVGHHAPLNPNSQETVWREEYVKAIDSSLRKERWLVNS